MDDGECGTLQFLGAAIGFAFVLIDADSHCAARMLEIHYDNYFTVCAVMLPLAPQHMDITRFLGYSCCNATTRFRLPFCTFRDAVVDSHKISASARSRHPIC
jgi:hypothetical protein